MNKNYKLRGRLSPFWLFTLALIILLGIYLLDNNVGEGAVQVFGGGVSDAPNRSFADLVGG